MRAQTVTHVEYEIFKCVLDTVDITTVKEQMCPMGDKVAEERFNKGFMSSAKLIQNLCNRRTHKLPKDHLDYKHKGVV